MVSLRSARKGRAVSTGANNSDSDSNQTTAGSSQNPRKRSLFPNGGEATPKPKQPKTSNFQPEITFPHNEEAGIGLACGQGDTGQLGLGDSVTERKRFQPVKMTEKIVQIICGGMHTVCLTPAGDVYTFGCNDESALGRKTEEEEDTFVPMIVEIPNITKIVQITAGDSHSAALDASGSVYIWGIFRDSQGTLGLSADLMQHCISPLKLSNIPEMVKIASGYNHLVMLSSLGDVYSVGAAEQGELGRVSKYQSVKGGRRGLSSVLEPGMVYFVGKQKTANIWSFGYNSFFLSSKNILFGCGLNNFGQTGTQVNNNNVFVPTKVKAFVGMEIKEVAGGDHHTLFLTTEDHVYGAGRGDLGRLGIHPEPKDPEYVSVPQKLDIENVRSIAAGSCVSFAVTQRGDLYAWGAGTNNQLGLGDDEDYLKPEKVSSKQLTDRKVIQVSAGGQHSTCLVVDRNEEEESTEVFEVKTARETSNLKDTKHVLGKPSSNTEQTEVKFVHINGDGDFCKNVNKHEIVNATGSLATEIMTAEIPTVNGDVAETTGETTVVITEMPALKLADNAVESVKKYESMELLSEEIEMNDIEKVYQTDEVLQDNGKNGDAIKNPLVKLNEDVDISADISNEGDETAREVINANNTINENVVNVNGAEILSAVGNPSQNVDANVIEETEKEPVDVEMRNEKN